LNIEKKKKCIEREDYWIIALPHEYNILEKAGSRLGSIQSDATRIKISIAKKGKPRPSGSGKPSQSIEVFDL
jgi:hypothetical protein